jgi:hypothetical protein
MQQRPGSRAHEIGGLDAGDDSGTHEHATWTQPLPAILARTTKRPPGGRFVSESVPVVHYLRT